MQVVTSGHPYIDIDAYAGCVAYAELLRAQDHAAVAASSAIWNASITDTVRAWRGALETGYRPGPDDTFVLVDVSEPAQLDPLVRPGRVTGILDHHPGREQYWHERLGAAARIEHIGAASTQVYEAWQASGLSGRISTISARLLMTAILDNTLNFGAQITTPRDRRAYDALRQTAGLPDTWPARYFGECQQAILADVAAALATDTKILSFKGLPETIAVGQLAVWDARGVLAAQQQTLAETMRAKRRPGWFVNVVSIGEGRSYFVGDDPAVQRWLHALLGVTFRGSVAPADRLWLRKEIIKQALEIPPAGSKTV